MEKPPSTEPYAASPPPTDRRTTDRPAAIWSDPPATRRGPALDVDSQIDPDPLLGQQSSLGGDPLSDGVETAIRPKPTPAGRHRLPSPEDAQDKFAGAGRKGAATDREADVDPLGDVDQLGGVRSNRPQPVRPWEIGDPGDSFTQIRPLYGSTLDTPDTVLDGGQLGTFSVYAASVRGLSHRQTGTPRQDAYGVATSKDERWLVLTVADGVSSGRQSHRAAQIVARHATHQVARMLDGRATALTQTEWYDLFHKLSQQILSTGEQRMKVSRSEVAAAMATTVTVLVCPTEAEDGQRRVQVAWLGDSPAWVIEADGTWSCLTEVKGAGQEVASSATVALPQLPDDSTKLPVREQWVGVHAVILAMSDGVGDPLGDGTGEVGRALAQAWSGVPASALDFALQVGFGRKSYDDDRTVVGVWDPAGIEP